MLSPSALMWTQIAAGVFVLLAVYVAYRIWFRQKSAALTALLVVFSAIAIVLIARGVAGNDLTAGIDGPVLTYHWSYEWK